MGSPRQALSAATFGVSEIVRSQKKSRAKAEAERAAGAIEVEQEDVAEAVPTLASEEVIQAGKKARRRVQRLLGRRATRLSVLGGAGGSLGDRPIAKTELGGFA